MSHRRAYDSKSWEIDILQQLAYAKTQEDAALRREVVAQVKTLQAYRGWSFDQGVGV